MKPSNHARQVAMRFLHASDSSEKQHPTKSTQHCLSPTDPSEDSISSTMASPVLTSKSVPVTSPNLAKSSLPGLQFAISTQRAPSRELRLPSFSSALYEQENDTPAVSSADEGEVEQLTMDKTSAQRRKKGTRRGTLHPEAKNVLKAWMFSPEHFAHPYPSEEEKEELATEAGIEVKQLSNWFTNARKRLWQPVLRQSGVEVKNFLSTGRGGPRGNKLDVPANLHQLVSPSPIPSPPSSPRKRSWSASSSLSTVSTTSPLDETKHKKNFATRKRSKLTTASWDKDRLPQLYDLELLAATSLLKLHHLNQSIVEAEVQLIDEQYFQHLLREDAIAQVF
ncbi:hypothetical protein KXD40_009693 [Peronospora effusa]|nr:hypothetical protein KXD40_009693 [Peronospora effusa]CAI5706141.1 unnamed protein product [Peronospora effusa]